MNPACMVNIKFIPSIFANMLPSAILITAAAWLFATVAIAIIAGSSSALFLWLLDSVTTTQLAMPWLLFLLPIGGGLVGWLYQRFGGDVAHGTEVLYTQVAQPTQQLPFRMAPLVFVGTLVTHLAGGSAGREGTAVQVSGVIADSVGSWLTVLRRHRRALLVIGIATGFASVFGTPLAGGFFALEVVRVPWRERARLIVPLLLAAYAAHFVCLAWGIHHISFPSVGFDAPYPMLLIWALVVGVGAMAVAHTFHWMKGGIGTLSERWIAIPWLRPAAGGVVIAACIAGLNLWEHAGLSLPLLLQSFVVSVAWYHVVAKVSLTALTLGSGFKGGEVTPLFVIGATMGSTMASLGGNVASMAAMGMVAVFAAATRTPVASAILACELFGWQGLPWYAVACVVGGGWRWARLQTQE